MKREQAINMLRQWHEECIEAAKGLPTGYQAIVETQERTYSDGTAYQYEAVIWDEAAEDKATARRWNSIYAFRSDDENIAIYNENLEAFKTDAAKLKKQHAA